MADEGWKLDESKLRYDLIPPEALAELAYVYTIGAKTHGDNNYLGGMKWRRIYGALLRHIQAFWGGEAIDQDDGQYHLASVAWCAFTLHTYFWRRLGTDDRPNTDGWLLLASDDDPSDPGPSDDDWDDESAAALTRAEQGWAESMDTFATAYQTHARKWY